MGSLIYAIGVNMFLIPHKLLSGGVLFIMHLKRKCKRLI
ncbi:hypothetical protein C1149_17495 [Clostridium botulinum]|nr:hypothetical protein C1149_17495 [Clostridium botulinum]